MDALRIFLALTLAILPISRVGAAEAVTGSNVPSTEQLLADPGSATQSSPPAESPKEKAAAAPDPAPASALDPNKATLSDPVGPVVTPLRVTPAARSMSVPRKAVVSNTPLTSGTVLEQGKALYENGQYVSALDKFMQVLRRDPQQPEARHYLQMVVDQMRQQRKPGQSVSVSENVPRPVLDEEIRKRVRQRQLLTLDLGAIDGVHVSIDSKQAQVEIKSSLLFGDKTGGLKEEGIPILDRVAVWLKTFGDQTVIIHCYPEELQDPSTNGSLFLHRFAQLYGFFIDERRLSAARFVKTDILKAPQVVKGSASGAVMAPGHILEISQASPSSVQDAPVNEELAAKGPPRIVIASVGDETLSTSDGIQSPRWLEFSILASHLSFNPEEGDWASLDLAALSRKGVKSWSFEIVPEKAASRNAKKKNAPALFNLSGNGNLLQRISWDGRVQKTGDFVPAGTYLCLLKATDVDGSTLTQDISLKVLRSHADLAELAPLPKPKPKPHPKAPPKPAKNSAAAPAVVPPDTQTPDAATAAPSSETAAPLPSKTDLPAGRQVAPTETAGNNTNKDVAEPPAAADTSEPDSSDHAIWKQVIQFDANASDLKPTVKASLERIGKTLEVYPLQKVRIMGFAEQSETNATGLAKERAEAVRETLITEYQVDARRVIVAGGKVGSAAKVEISITN